MKRTFKNLKVNDVIYISNAYGKGYTDYCKPINNLGTIAATVTNIEVHGNQLIISYKSAYFNHTTSVCKEAYEKWVRVYTNRSLYRKTKCWYKYSYMISVEY